jgi:CHAT domain-containing protein
VGVDLFDQGKSADAEVLLRDALERLRAVLGKEHPDAGAAGGALAGALTRLGRHTESEALLRDALDVNRKVYGEDHFETALALNHLAGNLEERGRHAELLARLGEPDKQAAALFRKSGGAEAAGEPLQALTRRRKDVQGDLDRLRAEWSRREVFDLERVQQALLADAALLAWVDVRGHGHAADPSGEHWACVVRSRGEPAWVRLPGTGPTGAWTAEDRALPGQLYATLNQPGKADLKDLLRRAAAQRLAPVESQLAGVRTLLVVPAGAMAGIPVEALTDRHVVSYVPSGTVLARLGQKARPAEAALLALGDPVFTRAGEKAALEPLPGTRREVNALAGLFPRTTVLLGSDASQQRLEELAASDRLRQFRYLHLATHGVIDAGEPGRSALILAQDHLPDALEQVRQDRHVVAGRVAMRDVLETWHLDADLVTLSACRTALGRDGGGDGFVGFSQALLLAGARACVLSLWPVDDTATALLMVRFYKNLLGRREGLTAPLAKAQALHEAKAWLRELTSQQVDEQVTRLPKVERGSPRERARPLTPQERPFDHPYYWSAFILVGEPG